jgi:hypothetical protein
MEWAGERVMRATWMMAAMLLGWAGVARAQAPCPEPAKVWLGAAEVPAAHSLAGNPNPMLTLGVPAIAALSPAEGLTFAAPLGKPVVPGDKGGLFVFHIGLTGTYRVALGGKAWIDVVQRGKSLPSAAHAHGEPCSGIAKMVDFALTPGDYILQLSDTQAASLPVLLTRLP